MKKILLWMAILPAFILFVSCGKGDEPGGGVLDKEKMKLVLRDVLMAEEFVQSYVVKDSTKKLADETIRLYNQVFKIHSIRREQFLKSFDYYLSKPYLAKEMFDSLSVQMRRVSVSAAKTIQ
jgi:hypothetical protein